MRRIRYIEVLLACAVPALAAFFSLERWTDFSAGRFLIFCPAVFLLCAHIFAFNDWVEPGPAGKNKVFFPVFLGLAALGLFSMIAKPSLAIAAVIVVLSFLYSGPAVRYKAVPVASSLAHFFGAGLLFLLGYCLFRPGDLRGVWTGIYFALLICAGHLVHETRDHFRDQNLGLTTNSVRFGRGNAFQAAFVLFSLAAAYLAVLAFSGLVPFLWIYGGLGAYILHVGQFQRTLAQDPGLENLQRFRRDYRLVYMACGVYMWLVLVWQIKK